MSKVLEMHFQPYRRTLREQPLSLTRTRVEGSQQGYEIFLMKFAGV